MSIVGGFDIHRQQITFDYVDTITGEVKRGRSGTLTGTGSLPGCAGSRGVRMSSSRSRGALGGVTWLRKWSAPVSPRIWPNRLTRPQLGDGSGTRKRTGPTRT